jgi:hypothetical protein
MASAIRDGGKDNSKKKEASQSDKSPVALMNGERLVSLLMEYNNNGYSS